MIHVKGLAFRRAHSVPPNAKDSPVLLPGLQA